MVLPFLIIFFSYITLITQFLINETVAESLPLIFILIFLVKNQKNIIKENISVSVLFLLYLALYMLIITLYFNGISGSLIFSYQIVFLILSLLIIIPKSFNPNSVYVLVGSFSALTSIISIVVYYIYPDGFSIPFLDLLIQSDTGRARGLSRSTLNYSSLSLLGLLATLQIRDKNLLKYTLLSIIMVGIILSKSRGALLPALFALFFYMIFFSKKRNVIFLVLLLSLIYYLSPSWFYERLISAFNFETERSNIDRLYSYRQFFNDFTFHGMGYGSTGPAALRFNESATGFESYILQFIYQSGFLGILIFCFILAKMMNSRFIILFLFYLPLLIMASVQQTFETPVVFTISLLLFICIQFGKYEQNTTNYSTLSA